jgi:L-rhamnose isomerase
VCRGIIEITERETKMVDAFEILEYTQEAKGIAFDTCHKIYILMDDEQMNLMKQYEYDPLISSDELDPEELANKVVEWYEESCGLRFINAVYTTENANDGYIQVVPQFADNEDEDED